ncbi:hypothetical protein EPI10_021442 [Gossypium australe]|uniref:Reverse transcriptase Ty1/copia-type domain-containing protein n=1 Tax=Gossypium australe TaxID=47621 RepID=A0A5B6WIQ0_9ROSI|nr:hypothetical protein EPI10_021442 [Gossypium australe]
MSSSQSSSKLLVFPLVYLSNANQPPVVSTTYLLAHRVNSLNNVRTSSSPSFVNPLYDDYTSRSPSTEAPDQPQPQPPVILNSQAMVTRSKANIFKPKAYLSMTTCLSNATFVNINETMSNDCWKDAVQMVRATAIQTVLTIAVMKGLSLRKIDVNNPFLNGNLTEEIYMNQPPEFEVSSNNGQRLVCRLNKELYGTFLLLMAYVDDIVITCNANGDIEKVVHQLHTTAITTPMVSTPKLVASDGSLPFADVHLYRSVVGMLQYMCITRPDLSFCVDKLSQYMNSASDTHWKAVKRVSSVEDRCSTTRYVVYLRPTPVAWCSKKQAVVSRSSSEAKHRSWANCVSKLLWVKQLLAEVGLPICQSLVVWCDNTSTVSMAANLIHHTRVKHIETDHHFVREKVLDDVLQVNFVPSTKQVVDVLTKPITPKQFTSIRNALRVLSVDDDLDVQVLENRGNVKVTD